MFLFKQYFESFVPTLNYGSYTVSLTVRQLSELFIFRKWESEQTTIFCTNHTEECADLSCGSWTVSISLFLNMAPCRLVPMYGRFGRTSIAFIFKVVLRQYLHIKKFVWAVDCVSLLSDLRGRCNL